MYEPGWLDPRKDPRAYLPEMIRALRGVEALGVEMRNSPLCGAAADVLEKLAVLPLEVTPEMIQVMEDAFFEESAVKLRPEDPMWKAWTRIYHAIVEAARGNV